MTETVSIASDIEDIFTEAATPEIKQKALTYLVQLGGRKFLLAMLIYLGTAVLTWYVLIDEGIYSVVTLGVIASYIAGNIAQDATVANTATDQAITYLSKLGGRKFTLSLTVFIGTAILCWFLKIHGNVFSVVTVTLIAGYIAGNVIQKKIA